MEKAPNTPPENPEKETLDQYTQEIAKFVIRRLIIAIENAQLQAMHEDIIQYALENPFSFETEVLEQCGEHKEHQRHVWQNVLNRGLDRIGYLEWLLQDLTDIDSPYPHGLDDKEALMTGLTLLKNCKFADKEQEDLIKTRVISKVLEGGASCSSVNRGRPKKDLHTGRYAKVYALIKGGSSETKAFATIADEEHICSDAVRKPYKSFIKKRKQIDDALSRIAKTLNK